MTLHDRNLIRAEQQLARRSISWRKTLLLHRSDMLEAWCRHFPRHSFVDLHLIRSPLDWDEEAWARAARAYHQERKSKKGNPR